MRDKEVPGDARESMLRFQEAQLQIAYELSKAEGTFDAIFETGTEIQELRIRLPQDDGQGYLVVIKALSEKGKIVGFHDGTTLTDALLGALRRLKQGNVRFKPDEWTQG